MSDSANVISLDDGKEAVFHAHTRHLQTYLNDETLREIVINRPGEVLVESRDGWARHERPEITYDLLFNLATIVANMTHQSISAAKPLLSATLMSGERIQVVMPPAVASGTISMTIRKPSKKTFSLDELKAGGLFKAVRKPGSSGHEADDAALKSLLAEERYDEFLALAVKVKKNIIISGATGSGKTTLSKAMIQAIPDHERIITIEDARELEIPQPNNVRLFYSKDGQGQAKIGPKELLESCLRMRPDRIFLGELRDGTAFYYLRNVNSGHPGSITTVHASSAEQAFEQLTLLVKENEVGRDLDRADIRKLLTTLIDVIIQCHNTEDGFRVTEIYFDPDSTRVS